MENKYQVMPPLTEEEYAALKADIAASGVRVAVVKDAEGHTIDGYHRERAWRELRDEGHDVPDYPIEVCDLHTDDEKRELAWKLNMQRRHLSRDDKRNLVEAKLKETPWWSNHRIANTLGVSDHTVSSARLHLEATSQIAKFEALEGADGKKPPRRRERDLREEFEATQQAAVRRRILRTEGGEDDQQIAEDIGVAPEVVASERYDLATGGAREMDLGLFPLTGRDDLFRMKERLTPRSNKEVTEEVKRALEQGISALSRAIEGRRIDHAISPEEFLEELDKDDIGRALGLTPLRGRLDSQRIRSVGEWLLEFADLLDRR